MAQFGIQRKARSVTALVALLAVIALMAYAVAAGVQLGWSIYILTLFTMVLAWFAKEDSIVVGGVMLLSLLVMLDVTLYIGIIGPYP